MELAVFFRVGSDSHSIEGMFEDSRRKSSGGLRWQEWEAGEWGLGKIVFYLDVNIGWEVWLGLAGACV